MSSKCNSASRAKQRCLNTTCVLSGSCTCRPPTSYYAGPLKTLQDFNCGNCDAPITVESWVGQPGVSGSTGISAVGLDLCDRLIFWTDGTMDINVTSGSARVQLDAVNLLCGTTGPQEPPPAPFRNFLYTDSAGLTGVSLYSWCGVSGSTGTWKAVNGTVPGTGYDFWRDQNWALPNGINDENVFAKRNADIGVGVSGSLYVGDRLRQGRINIGLLAGATSDGDQGIAIGYQAAQTNQSFQSIALGFNAGSSSQGITGIGFTGQAIAIGPQAGETYQSGLAVALSALAGQVNQGTASVAIGGAAGQVNQGMASVAIGVNAGNTSQGVGSIAIGSFAGATNLGNNSICIGRNTNSTGVTGSIALGSGATVTSSAIGVTGVTGPKLVIRLGDSITTDLQTQLQTTTTSGTQAVTHYLPVQIGGTTLYMMLTNNPV